MMNNVLSASTSYPDNLPDATGKPQVLKRSSFMQLYPLNDGNGDGDDDSQRWSGRFENTPPHPYQDHTADMGGDEFPFEVNALGRIVEQVQNLRESYPVLDSPMKYREHGAFDNHEGAHWPRYHVREHCDSGVRLEDRETYLDSKSTGCLEEGENCFFKEKHAPVYHGSHLYDLPDSGRHHWAYQEPLGWYVHLDQWTLGAQEHERCMENGHTYYNNAFPLDFVQFKKSPYRYYEYFKSESDSDDLYYVDFRPGPEIYACVEGLKGGYEAFKTKNRSTSRTCMTKL